MLYVVIGVGLGVFVLERLFPDQALPQVKGWWWRAVLFNLCQLGVVMLGGLAWDELLQRASLFHLGQAIPTPWVQGVIGYVVATFVYYWWHRFRHLSPLLWRVFHQLHHSPARIETITSFYKHPTELFANSILSGATSYTLLGLSLEGAAWVTLLSACSEFFYHMNLRTPRFVGYLIQRPEMHRIHHERGVHSSNFGDLPIWDLLFGTYRNPDRYDGPCGFEPPMEQELSAMLRFQDLHHVEQSSP